ncbi:T9SS type A sorting domain-containing protein [uncultured Polaribacter sp.]|uniref:T9SS type A sorting domain-containing protein n=1 Tax=uncultured Polaribacter sp. TaxID=174711 RepID=UPI00261A0A59|nr:T9SS type A sorting domain-containing protein [uncultured Polaribacter sp.]
MSSRKFIIKGKQILAICMLICTFSYSTFAQQITFEPIPDFFRIKRELPLIELSTATTINVSDYGAIINDGNDDTQAITDALKFAEDNASASNPIEVKFKTGVYDIGKAYINNDDFEVNDETHTFFIDRANNIVVNGNNAEILLHDPSVGFMRTSNSENIIIKDFIVDYSELPFTQGTVVQKNSGEGNFYLEIDEGFPMMNRGHIRNAPQRWGMLKNTDGSLKEGAPNLISTYDDAFQFIRAGTFRYRVSNSDHLNYMEIGDKFVFIARYNGKTTFTTNNCKQVTYLRNTSYTSVAGSYNGSNNREWNVINCKLTFKPDSSRLHTANADCFHINSGFIGPWIQGSLFEGYSDDAMNLKHTRREILSVQANNQLTLQFDVVVGDTLRFYNPRDGIDLGTANVTAVQNLGNNEFRTTLSKAINITTISGNDHQTDDRCYIENRSSESFVLRDNVFRNARRYGLLIQGTYGIVENNTFENLSTGGIKIRNAAGWGEGFAAKHITINNNVFRNCGYDTTYLEDVKSAAITVYLSKLVESCSPSTTSRCDVVPTNWQGIENITITNNDISYNKKGIDMRNVNTALIQCNTINPNSSFIGSDLGKITRVNNSNVTQANDNCNLSINEFKKQCWDFRIKTNQIDFNNNCNASEGNWFLYDLAGRLISSDKFESTQNDFNEININHLKTGIYLLTITSNEGTITKKIFKR